MLVTFLTDTVRLSFTASQFKALSKMGQRFLLRLSTVTQMGEGQMVICLSHDDWHLYEEMRAVVLNPVHLIPSAN